MNTLLTEIFGHGKDLTYWQMASRGVLVFIIALVLIRISGRRSFGVRTALDNIIVILLGAVLSRAVVGASPFIPVIATSFVIVIMHRFFAWLMIYSPKFAQLVEGKKIILYNDGHFIDNNLIRGMVTKEDIMQGVRKSALTENLDKISTIWIERNGEISAIKKEDL